MHWKGCKTTYRYILQRIVEFLLIARNDHDVGTFPCEELAETTAHTLGTASHYHGLQGSVRYREIKQELDLSPSTLPSTSKWFLREKKPIMSSARIAMNRQSRAIA